MKIYVPRDAAALGVGADETAQAIVAEAKRRGIAVEIVRNGSRGLLWLEPFGGRRSPCSAHHGLALQGRDACFRSNFGPVQE